MKRALSHSLGLCLLALFFVSCADEEQEQLLLQLQQDMTIANATICLLYTSPSPRDLSTSRMPSSA